MHAVAPCGCGQKVRRTSATSHAPAAALHTVPDGLRLSGGQPACAPVQRSSWSQMPAAGRQTCEVPRNEFAGQKALDPVHDSGASHGPAAALHTVVAALYA